jgi:hypothetical protein
MVKKKKTLEKKSNAKNSSVKKSVKKPSRKDFEVFAQGVERLEELRRELNGLDSSKFPVETASIKSKLKNVSYIPQIENEIRVLKSKIRGTHKVKVVKRKGDDVHKEIKRLEKEIKKRQAIAGKSAVSNMDKKFIRDLPKMENEMRSLKQFVNTQRSEEKRKRELLKKIDPSVSLVVDDKFNLTLNEIKAELSKKLKEKESEVQKQLQDDLEARKRNFELRYGQLENKFSERYDNRVSSSLKREVKKKFNEELRKRVESLRAKVKREYIKKIESEVDRKLMRVYDRKKAELVKKGELESKALKEEYAKKKAELIRNGKLEEKSFMARYAKKKAELIKNEKLNEKRLKEKEEKFTLELSRRIDDKKKAIKEYAMKKEELIKRMGLTEESFKRAYAKKKAELIRKGNLDEESFKRAYDKKRAELIKRRKLEEKRLKEREQKFTLELSNIIGEKKKFFQKGKLNIKNYEEHIKKLKDELKKDFESRREVVEKRFRKVYAEKEKRLKEREEKFTLELSNIIGEKKKMIQKGKIKIKLSKNHVDQLKEELKKEFESKKKEIESDYLKKMGNEKTKLKQHFQEEVLANRIRMNNKLHEHITQEVKKLHKEHDVKAKVESGKIDDIKKRLANEKGALSRIRNNLSSEVRKVRAEGEDYKKRVEERLVDEKDRAVKMGVAKQSVLIKKQLQQEFDDRLVLELQKKQADFDKKKANLNLILQSRMKQMLS